MRFKIQEECRNCKTISTGLPAVPNEQENPDRRIWRRRKKDRDGRQTDTDGAENTTELYVSATVTNNMTSTVETREYSGSLQKLHAVSVNQNQCDEPTTDRWRNCWSNAPFHRIFPQHHSWNYSHSTHTRCCSSTTTRQYKFHCQGSRRGRQIPTTTHLCRVQQQDWPTTVTSEDRWVTPGIVEKQIRKGLIAIGYTYRQKQHSGRDSWKI